MDSDGKYLDHATISDKRAITQNGKLMDVLEKYDSKKTLEILKTDGENANRCGIFGFCFLLFPQNEGKKTYKLRQTKLSQIVYFSLVLKERGETKTKYSAP